MFFGDIFFFISRKTIHSKVRLHLVYPQVYTHIHLYKITIKPTFPHYPQPTKSYQHFIYTIKPTLSTDNMGFIHKLWLIMCITMLQYLILDSHLRLMLHACLVHTQLSLPLQSLLHYLCIKIAVE